MSHMKRYNTLCGMTGRNNLDSAYHAAFYLLAYDKEVFEAASKCVSIDGIEFSKLKRTTRGFDERTRFVIDIAHNLFSYNSPCKATPFEISRLGYPLMEHVCNALYIAADQVRVEIRQNEKGQGEMVLDATPYEKTKRAAAYMEQLQASMMDTTHSDEQDEWER